MERRSFVGRLGAFSAALFHKVGFGQATNPVPRERRIYADDYLGVASDFGAVVNFILTQVGKRAATIVVPNRSLLFSTAIDLTNSRAIRITGEALGNPNSVTDWGPNLIWRGGARSGPAVRANGSTALEWDHINLSYNDRAYDSNLFSLGTGGVQDTSTTHIHHCRISGTPTARRAARLIELNTTGQAVFDHLTMDYAVVGIGATGSSQAITIGPGCWFDKHFADCAIRIWGSAWTVGEVVHECDPAPGVALTPLARLAGYSSAIAFRSCWSGDGGNGGGAVIDLDTGGFEAHGVDLQGVLCTHASGTFLKCSEIPGRTSGVNMRGCRISGMTVGAHLGRSDSAVVKGNRLACAIPWTGTEPTRYDAGPNDLGNFAAAAGVPIAHDLGSGQSIAITPPGSAHGGLGQVFITSVEDGSHARFELCGSQCTTRKAEDLAGHFSATRNIVASMNVFWDAGTSSYRLQNKRGAKRTVIVTYLGR